MCKTNGMADPKDNEPEPRIAPLSREEYGADAMSTIAELLKAQAKPIPNELPDFIATMLRHRELFQCQADMTRQLFSGAFAFRDTELVLLRTTWLCQAPYVFSVHVETAKDNCGFSSEDIERIVQGSTALGWDEHSRALLQATEELIKTSHICDETWALLSKSLDDRQLIELPILVGHFQGVAYVQNAMRVRLMPGYAGLAAR